MICNKCKLNKPSSAFRVQEWTNGRQADCIACQRAYQREYQKQRKKSYHDFFAAIMGPPMNEN